LVFIKQKVTKSIFKKKTKTETSSNRPVSVRFGFFGTELVQTGLDWFFQFGSVFSGLGSVRLGFFYFRFIKPKPNRSVFAKF